MTNFILKCLDGTPVEPEYEERISKLISNAAAIELQIDIDDLEDYAEEQRKKENKK
ncbi:hypothetical protein [Glaciimonas soli]|uniref:hypothetical protein n=1 Tax=Glaciimonas soli TaxID=2590999 RepID=UPI00129393F2|nr:hypothetical protein [Glaciimonas soli]